MINNENTGMRRPCNREQIHFCIFNVDFRRCK